jgi:hypothetical protein
MRMVVFEWLLATVVMVGNAVRNRTETAANTSRGILDSRGRPVTADELERLLHRGDECPPRTGGHAQGLSVAVLGVPHHHGVGSTGDLYALATVRT